MGLYVRMGPHTKAHPKRGQAIIKATRRSIAGKNAGKATPRVCSDLQYWPVRGGEEITFDGKWRPLGPLLNNVSAGGCPCPLRFGCWAGDAPGSDSTLTGISRSVVPRLA